MSQSHLHRRYRPVSGRINMTPMIDVTFLLLTFFMLASHFASAEKDPDVQLPRPDDNQATERRFRDKIIINALYTGEETRPEFRLGALRVDSIPQLADWLDRFADKTAPPQVILRADRRLAYGDVRQVMEIVAAAGLSRLQVVTELDGTP
jgi:biopolymer transport protein ExbD